VKTFTAPGYVLAASLYNFDIDDATVKREHRDWLDSNLLPQLKASPATRIALSGRASRSGTADHARALSQRRVEAVRGYLASRGMAQAQATSTFTGKDLSVSTNVEDEADLAVLVLVETPAPRSPFTRFDRVNPGGKNDGFERRAYPGARLRRVNVLSVGGGPVDPTLEPYKMVPLGKDGEVVARNAVGLFAASGDPDVAFVVDPTNPARHYVEVKHNPQTFRIHGQKADNAIIFLNQRPPSRPDDPSRIGSSVAVLQVTVLPPVIIKVMFHFVRGPSGVRTARGEDKRTKFLKRLNEVYPPQANITFQFLGAGFTSSAIAGLTGPGVKLDDKKATDDWKIIRNARNPGADVNVFFVGKMIINPPLTGFSAVPPDPALGDFRVSIVDDDADPDDDFSVEHEVCRRGKCTTAARRRGIQRSWRTPIRPTLFPGPWPSACMRT
jgi:hypothetical protein